MKNAFVKGRGLRLATALAASAILALAPTTQAQAAAGSPFDPGQGQIFASKSATNNDPTGLFELTPGSPAYTFTAIGSDADLVYNALAYNTHDNYLYAVVTNANGTNTPKGALIKIGVSGDYERVGTATFLDAGDPTRDENMGAYDPDNKELWVMSAQGVTIHRIDLDPASAGYGTSVGTATLDHTHDGVAEGSDWAFSGGELFSLGRDGFFRVNPDGSTDGPFQSSPDPADARSSLGGNDQAGAAWTLLGDDLGFSYNGSGQVLRVRVTNPTASTPTFTVLSKKAGAGSGQNDGAASPGTVDLAIEKTGQLIQSGARARYTLTVSNNGSADSSGWTVTDTLPKGLSNAQVSGDGQATVSGSSVTVTGPLLPAGETRTITIVAQVSKSLRSFTNVARVEGNDPDVDPDNNVARATLTLPAVDVEAPDTGEQRKSPWATYLSLAAGLLILTGVAGRAAVVRRREE